MKSREVIEYNVNIADANAPEVAAAVRLMTGKIYSPLQKVKHPNSDDYPETYCMWEVNGDVPIFGVSRLHRPKIGPNGADFRYYDPTNEYRIIFYQQGYRFDVDVLKRTINLVQEIQEDSLAGRLRGLMKDVRWVLTKAPINFP